MSNFTSLRALPAFHTLSIRDLREFCARHGVVVSGDRRRRDSHIDAICEWFMYQESDVSNWAVVPTFVAVGTARCGLRAVAAWYGSNGVLHVRWEFVIWNTTQLAWVACSLHSEVRHYAAPQTFALVA